MNGLELSRAFFEECGRPMLETQFPELMPFLAAGLFGSGDHGARVLDGAGHGLFGDHIAAQPQRLDGHGGVQVVRQADVHHVDVLERDHLMPVGIALRAGLFHGLGQAILADVAHRGDFHVRHAHERGDVHLADAAAADDGRPEFSLLHCHVPPV